MDTLLIPIEKPTIEFRKHLELENNNRILFSGMFGMGKTYFLDKFFNESDNRERYNYINLLPVHYSVSSNEDIFEYLKYDIASRLLANENIKLDANELSRSLHHSLYLHSKPADILSPLLKFIPIVGNASSHAYDKWMDIAKQMDEDYKSKSKNDVEILKEYTNNIINKIGTIYENDFYTLLIKKLLESWIDNPNKQNVLVIDDLDRIDPEHIFRLFNVFGAHTSANIQDSFENKFGFDKIIFVCDIENVRNIFASRYGENVDFSGYIDKFYSREIFYYKNEEGVLNEIKKIVKNIKLTTTSSTLLDSTLQYINSEINRHSNILEKMLYLLVKTNSVTLRALTRKYNVGIEYALENFSNINGRVVSATELPITFIIHVLKSVVGDEKTLVSSIDKFRNLNLLLYGIDKRNQLNIIGSIIHIADLERNNLELKMHKFQIANITLEYHIYKNNGYYSEVHKVDEVPIDHIDRDFHLVEIFQSAIAVLSKRRLIT